MLMTRGLWSGQLPRDAQAQVGWYYFAGHCQGSDGKKYGVLFMLYRNALMPPVMAEHFGLKQADLISACRTRAIARPRQAAMWLAKQLTTRSLPDNTGRKSPLALQHCRHKYFSR